MKITTIKTAFISSAAAAVTCNRPLTTGIHRRNLTVLCPLKWSHSGRSIACFARVGHQIAVQIFVDIAFIVGCNASSVELPVASLAHWIFRIRFIRSAIVFTSDFDLQNGSVTPCKNGLEKKPIVKSSHHTARLGLPVMRLKEFLAIDCVPIVCQIGMRRQRRLGILHALSSGTNRRGEQASVEFLPVPEHNGNSRPSAGMWAPA